MPTPFALAGITEAYFSIAEITAPLDPPQSIASFSNKFQHPQIQSSSDMWMASSIRSMSKKQEVFLDPCPVMRRVFSFWPKVTLSIVSKAII